MNNQYFELLTEYFIRENEIDTEEEFEVVSIPARKLICANRFDLMAKWIYIDAREKGINMDTALRVYRDNINSFSCGKFFEPGSDDKNSFQKYLDDFNNLIDEIKLYGFNDQKSIIPVDRDYRIFDGSHRVSIAAYYDKNVTVIRFLNKKPLYDYNYRYFRKYLMSDVNMGYMARQYAYLNKNCYGVCIWPAADRSKLAYAEEVLESIGKIVYSQDIYFTYEGMRNFMTQIYGNQSWIGDIDEGYSKVNYKVNPCYDSKGKNPVVTYLIEADSLAKVIDAKAEIRTIFGIENHSIHISDTYEEVCDMVELLYNPNSVNFMNHARPYKYKMIHDKLGEFDNILEITNLDKKRFVIDSSAVLEVCGLRPAKDLDYLTDYPTTFVNEILSELEEIDNHESQLDYHEISVKEMLYNPENYFYFRGFKFLSVERLREMKKNRNESKDIVDCKLCDEFINRFNKIPKQYRYDCLEKINRYQIEHSHYGYGPISYFEYRKLIVKEKLKTIKVPYKTYRFINDYFSDQKKRQRWIARQRKRVKNTNISVISSNCNGGVLVSDLGLRFNSPFVNLFIKATDYIKMLENLPQYMSAELRFVRETDPIYGDVDYPTAYLNDVKIYFMHYTTDEEALAAWNRRRARINWDNLYILFTDRSGCTQEDLLRFDDLEYDNKIVFTHIPHPEIKSSFYIRGFENEDKVPILTAFKDVRHPVKRIYDCFDFVKWINRGK